MRYNAQKTKVGMYHSTPIYKFTMPCHLCAGTIVIQTDPQNFDYVILEGARRKNQKWDPEENEQVVIADATEKKKLVLDAMYHLEHDDKDKRKASSVAPAINQLEVDRHMLKDDFLLNQLARKQFREAKRLALEHAAQDRNLLDRLSLTGSGVQLLPELESDVTSVKLMRISGESKSRINPRVSVDDQAVFETAPGSRPRSSGTPKLLRTPNSDSSLSEGSTSRSGSSKQAVSRPSIRSELLKQRGQAFDCTPVLLSKSNSTTCRLLLGVRRKHTSGESNTPNHSTVTTVDNTEEAPKTVDLVAYDDSD